MGFIRFTDDESCDIQLITGGSDVIIELCKVMKIEFTGPEIVNLPKKNEKYIGKQDYRIKQSYNTNTSKYNNFVKKRIIKKPKTEYDTAKFNRAYNG